jgi:hypothetical protein
VNVVTTRNGFGDRASCAKPVPIADKAASIAAATKPVHLRHAVKLASTADGFRIVTVGNI